MSVMNARSPHGLFRDLARMHVRAQRAALACRATSETQCTILTEVGRAGSVRMSDLVARLQLDKGWVSRAVDQLVQEGLVVRSTDPVDRRAIIISLTAAGTVKFKDVERCLDAQIGRVFARLKASDRQKVGAAMAILHQAYSEVAAERAADRASSTAA
jgi:DNA-binding MarR family transcriptional regulator